MLNKILKKDLNKNMRWLWIVFVSAIAIAGITRGCKELGENNSFFKILAIFFDSIFYTVAVNAILHPFLRNFLNFQKSFYSDESYLTHTLPIEKRTLINSKYITAIIEIVLSFITLVISLLIMFASPTMFDTLKLLFSTLISGEFSLGLSLTLIITLIIVEFLMFISIIFYSITLGYKSREHRVLKSFALTAAFSFASLAALSGILILVLTLNNISLTSSTLILSNSTFLSIILSGIIVYLSVAVLFYFLTKKEFSKGVNVD